jgi:hypothetical protein
MAMIQCRECGRELSKKVEGPCPACGDPDPSGRKARNARARMIGGLLIVMLGLLYLWMVALPQFRAHGLLPTSQAAPR